MTPDNPFPAISPAQARELFLRNDETLAHLFKPDFNQFIIGTLDHARSIIRFPVPPSRTGNHALILLTEGHIELSVGHQTYTLTAQELVIIPSLQIFSLTTVREGSQGFMCFFSPELVANTGIDTEFDFLKLTANPYVSLSALQTEFMTNLLYRLATEYLANGANSFGIIRPYLLALLAEISRAYVGTSPVRTDAGDRLVQRFMDLLNEHIRQNRLVSDYASLLSITPNHLNKVIKTRTGRSPSVWIDERIVLEAKVWLFQSTLSVAQVAAELGFDDQANFGKLFRKYANISPKMFRNRYADPHAASTSARLGK